MKPFLISSLFLLVLLTALFLNLACQQSNNNPTIADVAGAIAGSEPTATP